MDRDMARTAWRQIADALSGEIAAGRYGPGDGLPTALALAERYGVHRHTARQALLHLQQAGLVSVERGRGTFVTELRLPYRLGRRVRFRGNAEAAGATVEGRILSLAVTPAGEAAVALGIAPENAVWRIDMLSRAADVVVSTGTHYLDHARFPGFEAALMRGEASITRALAACGVPDYVRLRTALSGRTATEEEAALMEIAPGGALITSRGLDGTPDGVPVHLVEALFVGERVEFIVEPDAPPAS